ncbi:hypothetical protein RhiirA1_232361 [Rhizophagus irregularis]|uniref:Uncharacterized protein n=1 Tax=Rhizophagus irregularis TaxID=588596 RepID=A0A2N0RKK6_9GLOM|nr:hypothetical protein RhiirA1_232361 [Rhizophagus irregularis]GET64329.1 hypothetical protein RIR_jg6692.t1 [Rhizophagus irregularis DAOM 181602=DAOM 197198]
MITYVYHHTRLANILNYFPLYLHTSQFPNRSDLYRSNFNFFLLEVNYILILAVLNYIMGLVNSKSQGTVHYPDTKSETSKSRIAIIPMTLHKLYC